MLLKVQLIQLVLLCQEIPEDLADRVGFTTYAIIFALFAGAVAKTN